MTVEILTVLGYNAVVSTHAVKKAQLLSIQVQGKAVDDSWQDVVHRGRNVSMVC